MAHSLHVAFRDLAGECDQLSQVTANFTEGARVEYVQGSFTSLIGVIGRLLSELGRAKLVAGQQSSIEAGGELRRLTPGIGAIREVT